MMEKQQRTFQKQVKLFQENTIHKKAKQVMAGTGRAPDNTHPISVNRPLLRFLTCMKNHSAGDYAPNTPTRTGTVNFFNEEAGYGFISDNLTHESYFVYRGCLKEPIRTNDWVNFEIEKTPGGPVAANVRKVTPRKLRP